MSKTRSAKLTKEENRMLAKSFFYLTGGNFASSDIVGQGKSFAMGMLPGLKMFYKDKSRQIAAFARHVREYMNCHLVMGGLIAGISLALEKKNAELPPEEDIGSTITNVKASLMGPCAGIGDSFFYNCWRVIVAGIALGFCDQGSIFGPLFFVLFYGIATLGVKYALLRIGYIRGQSIVTACSDGGVLPLITKAASILGAIMIGAMVANNVRIAFNFAPEFNGVVFDLQGMLDAIAPGLASIALYFLVMKLVRKGTKVYWIIYGLMAACILLTFLKFF